MNATRTETLYVVRVNFRREDDGAPRDIFFRDQPCVFRSEEEAQTYADDLATSGDWGEVGPPEYYVDEVDSVESLKPAERSNVERYGIGQ